MHRPQLLELSCTQNEWRNTRPMAFLPPFCRGWKSLT